MENNEKTVKPKIYEVADAHLDTVWNWTLVQSVKWFLPNTFNVNLGFMDKYPEYRFNFEGAYRYALIDEYYPEAFEKIKARVLDGHWMVTGSSWEAGDVVVPEPETLMRNILYGNLYFREQFGKTSNDVFLPDCFGFPVTLPTVMRHMGLSAFSTAKIAWNPDPCKPPFAVGRWGGIDGAEVIASIKPGPYAARVRTDPAADQGLHDEVAALPLSRTVRYYGTGDDGGGPEESSVQRVNDAVHADGINTVVSAYAGQIADELTDAEKAQLPAYRGDFLMIEHGCGGYTSIGPNKRFHRINEYKADAAEKLAVLTDLCGAQEYPRTRIRKLWCDFIRHEFHDDLPGTSVARVYRETFHDDVVVSNGFDGEIGASLSALAANVDTSACGTDNALVVFNPVLSSRTDTVRVTVPTVDKAPVVKTIDGKLLPTQVLSGKDGKTDLIFTADLPSTGYATFALGNGKQAGNCGLSVTDKGLESARYRVALNENGDIASVYDKKNDRELLQAPIHFELVRNTYRLFGSWEIGYEDEIRTPYAYITGPATFEIVENGPVRVALRVTRTYRASRFEQTLSLDAAGNPLRVDNRIIWNETATILKCAFPLNLYAAAARYDRGLGSVACPDRFAQTYEVPVHKWANYYDSEADYSATIVNDCKYGMDKCGNILRLTCIHTPYSRFLIPTRQDLQDFGLNIFSFAVGGDRGDFVATGAERLGACFNQAPIAALTSAHGGILPASRTFVSGSEALSLKALKKAECSDEYIVRVVESTGAAQQSVSLTFANEIESVREVNGFENPLTQADGFTLCGSVLSFPIGAFTPKSFAVKFKKDGANASKTQYYPVSMSCDVPFTSDDEHRGAYGFGPENTTVPRRLMVKDFRVANVPLSLTEREGQFTCAYAAGQKLEVPQNADTLYLMAARTGDDAPYTVLADGTSVTFDLQSYTDDIGGWDQYALKHRGFIREARVAFCASHVHDTTGDRVYGRFSWYLIPVSLPVGAKVVTLPADNGVILAAATFAAAAVPASMVTDIALHKEQPKMHHLTVVGGFGTGDYPADTPLHIIYAGGFANEIKWHTDRGDEYSGPVADFVMPDADMTLTAVRFGDAVCRVPVGGHAVASSRYADNTNAANVLDGSIDTLWLAEQEGQSEITLDIGEKTVISAMSLIHAGAALGEQTRNASDFTAYAWYRGKWETLFSVTGNTEPATAHTFGPILTQYVKIVITNPGFNYDDHRAGLSCVDLFTHCDAPTTFGVEKNGPFDIVEQNESDDVLFAGAVQAGQVIPLAHTAVVSSRFITGAEKCTLELLNDNGNVVLSDSGAAARLLPLTVASAVRVVSLDDNADANTVTLTVCGNLNTLPVEKLVRGADYPGSANPGREKREDGTVLLPAGEGEGHDLWGFNWHLPLGDFTMGVRVRIPADALANAADDTPLFCFHPRWDLSRQEPKGRIFTVADWKAAPGNAQGYKLLTDSNANYDFQSMEGRIYGYRNLPLEVAEFLFLAGCPAKG